MSRSTDPSRNGREGQSVAKLPRYVQREAGGREHFVLRRGTEPAQVVLSELVAVDGLGRAVGRVGQGAVDELVANGAQLRPHRGVGLGGDQHVERANLRRDVGRDRGQRVDLRRTRRGGADPPEQFRHLLKTVVVALGLAQLVGQIGAALLFEVLDGLRQLLLTVFVEQPSPHARVELPLLLEQATRRVRQFGAHQRGVRILIEGNPYRLFECDPAGGEDAWRGLDHRVLLSGRRIGGACRPRGSRLCGN